MIFYDSKASTTIALSLRRTLVLLIIFEQVRKLERLNNVPNVQVSDTRNDATSTKAGNIKILFSSRLKPNSNSCSIYLLPIAYSPSNQFSLRLLLSNSAYPAQQFFPLHAN